MAQATKCPICRYGALSPGFTTFTLERDGRTLVFKRVPAWVCGACNEAFADEEVTARLLADAEAKVADRQAIIQLFGTIDYDSEYDYKTQRNHL